MSPAFLRLFLLLLPACYCCCSPGGSSRIAGNDRDGWKLRPFAKPDGVNPVLLPDSTLQFFCPVRRDTVRWAAKDVFNPAALLRNDTVFLLFRAEDKVGRFAGTSRLGLAWSTDGFHFNIRPEPVFYPDNDAWKQWEWEGGCEDPRVVQTDEGTYLMTYTAYDGKTARLMVATSPDLVHWTKHGPAFADAYNGKYRNAWSKSGAIVSRYEKNSPVAVKIHKRYWMYWGDVNCWAATSEDGIRWTPVEYTAGEKAPIPLRHNAVEVPELRIVFGPRPGRFDSDLVEPGPPALLTDRGILLLYNSRNVRKEGDTTLAEGTYAAGQVLMDRNDPLRVLQRTDEPFIRPEAPFEISGQVGNVCFIEGLVRFKGNWLLYYGTADSKIAVAVKKAETADPFSQH